MSFRFLKARKCDRTRKLELYHHMSLTNFDGFLNWVLIVGSAGGVVVIFCLKILLSEKNLLTSSTRIGFFPAIFRVTKSLFFDKLWIWMSYCLKNMMSNFIVCMSLEMIFLNLFGGLESNWSNNHDYALLQGKWMKIRI